MLTLDLILGSVKHSEIPWMLMEKIWNKISSLPTDGLSLLELCGAGLEMGLGGRGEYVGSPIFSY